MSAPDLDTSLLRNAASPPPEHSANASLLVPPEVRDAHEDRKRRKAQVMDNAASPRAVQRAREVLRRAVPEKRRISIRRNHTLNPIAKFRRYGRFPCKLVLNVIIFALLTAFLLGCHVPIAKEEETQRKSLVSTFMPESFIDPATQYYRLPTYYFGTIRSLRDWLAHTTEAYYALGNSASADYQYYTVAGVNSSHAVRTEDILPPLMEGTVRVASGRLSPRSQGSTLRHANMTLDKPYGLFGQLSSDLRDQVQDQDNYDAACSARLEPMDWGVTDSTRWFQPCRTLEIDNNIFDLVSEVTVTIRLRSKDAIDRLTLAPSVYDWVIEQRYSFVPNGLVTLTVTVRSELSRKADSATPWLGVLFTLVLFLVWDMALRARALVKIQKAKRVLRAQLAMLEQQRARRDRESCNSCSTRSQAGESSETSSSMSTEDDPDRTRAATATRWKMDLRNSMGKSWTQWALAIDTLALIFVVDKILGVFVYSQPYWLRYVTSIVGGVAIFGNAALFVSYMRFFPKLYVLMVATNVAWPHFLRFFVAVMPIYVGFGLFGVIVFGDYAPEFSTFFESLSALYCAIFGDSLLQMFQVTGATDTIILQQVGWLYSACFISFFIYAVLNIATAIILGSYTYVNETYNLYTTNVDRQVAPQKTIEDQLDEAVEQAQAALRRVAQLMTDERCRVRSTPHLNGHLSSGSLGPSAPPVLAGDMPLIVVSGENPFGASGAGDEGDPMQRYLDEQARSVNNQRSLPEPDATSSMTSYSSESQDGRRHRRFRRRGNTVAQGSAPTRASPDSAEFFNQEWVDRDVIF